jgi:hypothetical protein
MRLVQTNRVAQTPTGKLRLTQAMSTPIIAHSSKPFRHSAPYPGKRLHPLDTWHILTYSGACGRCANRSISLSFARLTRGSGG